jgi:YggT family protein
MNSIVYQAVNLVFSVIEFAIFAVVIISWLPIPKDNVIVRILYQITEPILAPIRGIIERSSLGKNMMFDFSPIIAFLLIGLIRNIVLSFIR